MRLLKLDIKDRDSLQLFTSSRISKNVQSKDIQCFYAKSDSSILFTMDTKRNEKEKKEGKGERGGDGEGGEFMQMSLCCVKEQSDRGCLIF